MRRLAIVAHDNKKVDLLAWATYNRGSLACFVIVATGDTARLLQDKAGLDVEAVLSGPEGGDAQIAARVATGGVDTVFFFVDPLAAQPHDPDIRALLPGLQRPQRAGRHEPRDGGSDHRGAHDLRRGAARLRLTRRYCAVQPPSTTSSLPVTNEDSSEARKSTQYATSSGSP